MHQSLALSRRVEKLTRTLDALIPASASILGVGCGSGLTSRSLQQSSPGRQFTGIDVVERDTCMIHYRIYDENVLPFAPASFDYVLFVDVLHHVKDAERLLAQAKRIARQGIALKRPYCEPGLDYDTLTLMDWFGNTQYGVPLPNRYKSTGECRELFGRLGVHEIRTVTDIDLYQIPFNMIFGRGL